MRTLFFSVLSVLAMTVCAQGTDTTFIAKSNPFVKYKYLGDPGALVDGNTLYVYAGHDQCPDNQERYVMNEWSILSTTDMKTWHEHSYKLKAVDFPWASGQAWASQCIKGRDGKYYWYITAEHKTIHGKAVGVAVSDSPTGPFVPCEKPIVTNDMTTAYTRISWDDIDPTAIVDDDGTAWLIWGNTQLYMCKLKPNMTEMDGDIIPLQIKGIKMPANPKEWNEEVEKNGRYPESEFYTEAPWIHKHKGRYYLSFSIGFPEKTAYAVSDNIMGPWEYKGVINEIAGNCNTNHHAIFQFKGQWYFLYHNGGLNTHGASYRRALCLDKLEYDKKGDIKRIQMTTEGIW